MNQNVLLFHECQFIVKFVHAKNMRGGGERIDQFSSENIEIGC